MYRSIAVLGAALVCLVLAATPAFGWGMGTHLFIAEHSLPLPQNPNLAFQAFYGAMLPDIDSAYFVLNRSSVALVRDLTHVSGFDLVAEGASGNPVLEAFLAGWRTHNEVWAADLYAHWVNPVAPNHAPGYVTGKTAVLPELPQAVRADYIETAVDLLVERGFDPYLGSKVCRAARDRSSAIPGLLVAAYCPPLIPTTVTRADRIFRDSAIAYGNMLMLTGSKDKYSAASILAASTLARTGRYVSYLKSLKYLERAMNACRPDYAAAVVYTIVAIESY